MKSNEFLSGPQRKVIENALVSAPWWENPIARNLHLREMDINTGEFADFMPSNTVAKLVIKQLESRGCLAAIEFIDKFLDILRVTLDGQLELRTVRQELVSYSTSEIAKSNIIDSSSYIAARHSTSVYPSPVDNSSSDYYSCFISYNHEDERFVTRLYNDLHANNVRCWKYTEDVRIGDMIQAKVEEAIQFHDKLLVIFSEHSVQSDWVADEVEAALLREQHAHEEVLFPIMIDLIAKDIRYTWVSKVRRHRHIADFTQWQENGSYQSAFQRLLRDLKRNEGEKK